MFDCFCKAFVEFAGGKCVEGLWIDDDEFGLMESAQKVFPFSDVYACFPADGGVDLSDDGGGDLDERYAPVEDGGDEAGEITDDSSTEGDDEAVSIMSGADHFTGYGFCLGE